jgi:hypothetical protein
MGEGTTVGKGRKETKKSKESRLEGEVVAIQR